MLYSRRHLLKLVPAFKLVVLAVCPIVVSNPDFLVYIIVPLGLLSSGSISMTYLSSRLTQPRFTASVTASVRELTLILLKIRTK